MIPIIHACTYEQVEYNVQQQRYIYVDHKISWREFDNYEEALEYAKKYNRTEYIYKEKDENYWRVFSAVPQNQCVGMEE
jgi:hypothetical protein